MASTDPQHHQQEQNQSEGDENIPIDPQLVEELEYSADRYDRSPNYVLNVIDAYSNAIIRDSELNINEKEKPGNLLKKYFDFLFEGFESSEKSRKLYNKLTFVFSFILVSVLIWLAWCRFQKVDELISSCLFRPPQTPCHDAWLITLPFSQGTSLIAIAAAIIFIRFSKRIRKRDI
ncbi:MAG: hypothetical protein ACOCZ8_03025 [Bacteroidota bacterium]